MERNGWNRDEYGMTPKVRGGELGFVSKAEGNVIRMEILSMV